MPLDTRHRQHQADHHSKEQRATVPGGCIIAMVTIILAVSVFLLGCDQPTGHPRSIIGVYDKGLVRIFCRSRGRHTIDVLGIPHGIRRRVSDEQPGIDSAFRFRVVVVTSLGVCVRTSRATVYVDTTAVRGGAVGAGRVRENRRQGGFEAGRSTIEANGFFVLEGYEGDIGMNVGSGCIERSEVCQKRRRCSENTTTNTGAVFRMDYNSTLCA